MIMCDFLNEEHIKLHNEYILHAVKGLKGGEREELKSKIKIYLTG